MAHSDCGWTCGCAGKTVKSIENTYHTWALLRWWFTMKRRYIKCRPMHPHWLKSENTSLSQSARHFECHPDTILKWSGSRNNTIWYSDDGVIAMLSLPPRGRATEWCCPSVRPSVCPIYSVQIRRETWNLMNIFPVVRTMDSTVFVKKVQRSWSQGHRILRTSVWKQR